jgi:predicted restriction endonuclease
VEYYLNKFCKECKDKGAHWARNSETGKLLKDQTITEASHKRAGGANVYDNIRCNARKLMMEQINTGTGCSNCGWSHHVQVCHIRAINSFPKDALVSEVNDLSNLMLLCPNCHWLFDNGKLPAQNC